MSRRCSTYQQQDWSIGLTTRVTFSSPFTYGCKQRTSIKIKAESPELDSAWIIVTVASEIGFRPNRYLTLLKSRPRFLASALALANSLSLVTT